MRVIQGFYEFSFSFGILEKKLKTTIVYLGIYIYRGYIGIIAFNF